MHRRQLIRVLGLATAVPALPFITTAQTRYPSRPITVIVGVQAGTGADVAMRTVAEKMSTALGQPVVVDNQAAAGGVVAAAKVARAAPDGHTLVALSSAIMTIRPVLGQKLQFDPYKELAAVAYVAAFPAVFYVHPNLPAKTLAQFIELARKQPGRLTYASPGVGSAQHLAMEQLKMMAGIDVVHVPFQGSALATTESVAGRVDSGFQGISTVAPYVKTGKLRALAWAERRRSEVDPSLPTIRESGYPEFSYEGALWLYAPAGTPAEVLNALNSEVRKAASDTALRAKWLQSGIESRTEFTPSGLDELARDELRRSTKIIQERRITAE